MIPQVTSFCAPGYLVQPADGRRFEPGFQRVIFGVDNLDFYFHGILPLGDWANRRYWTIIQADGNRT